MFLLLRGHDYKYEIKMLLNEFYHDEEYVIVDSVSQEGITIETIISDEYMKAIYYDNGKEVVSDYIDKNEIDNLPIELLKRRKETKRLLKRLIYNVISKVTGRKQAWGILTGIRPTKIVFELYNRFEHNQEVIKAHLENYYKISPLKVNLMTEIAKNEYKILETNKDNEVNIYIGIPFCPTKCLYCSFTSYPIDKWESHVLEYLEALSKEMHYVSKKLLQDKKIKTIYIGGGTPTSLNEEQLEKLMLIIHECFDVDKLEEFSVEAGRPDTINVNKLKVLRDYGVTRIFYQSTNYE